MFFAFLSFWFTSDGQKCSQCQTYCNETRSIPPNSIPVFVIFCPNSLRPNDWGFRNSLWSSNRPIELRCLDYFNRWGDLSDVQPRNSILAINCEGKKTTHERSFTKFEKTGRYISYLECLSTYQQSRWKNNFYISKVYQNDLQHLLSFVWTFVWTLAVIFTPIDDILSFLLISFCQPDELVCSDDVYSISFHL